MASRNNKLPPGARPKTTSTTRNRRGGFDGRRSAPPGWRNEPRDAGSSLGPGRQQRSAPPGWRNEPRDAASSLGPGRVQRPAPPGWRNEPRDAASSLGPGRVQRPAPPGWRNAPRDAASSLGPERVQRPAPPGWRNAPRDAASSLGPERVQRNPGPSFQTHILNNDASVPPGKFQNRNRNDSSRRNSDSSKQEDGNRRHAPRGRGRGRQTKQFSDRDRSRRRDRPLDVKRLKEMLDKEPTEIVMELATERSGWKEYLEQNDVSRAVVVFLLSVMAKACLCTSPRNLNSFLAVVCQSNFLSRHLSPFISSLSTVGSTSNEASDEELSQCRNIMLLLLTLLRCVPTFALDEVAVSATVLEYVFKSNDKIPDELKEQVKQLRGTCNDLQQNRENINEREVIRSQYQTPPNDFRRIPIIPETDEVRNTGRPFLRPNLIKGQYHDTEHYLDVQFRLLREDFVSPLREGVGEYLENRKDFDHNPRKRLQDVRLYHGVQIKRPVMTRDGTGYLIQFDTTPFHKMRWESSKRLINGSLLCLTEDDFQTVIFATVEGRDVRQLQRGQLEVRFIRLQDVIDKSSDATFLMAETSAYFESYRHVLDGLKGYREDNLPMKSYIVEASNEANPPSYLKTFGDSEPMYDFRLTYERLRNEVEEESTSNSDESSDMDSNSENDSDDDRFQLMTPSDNDNELDSDSPDRRIHEYLQRKLRAVNILQPSSWPEAEALHFDESQLEAFRAALSSEFVLIQGPPGTGKTYVGLEIVKSLLFNCHAWCHGDTEDWDFRPILVVCYTNHALDQFLEGIYRYEQGIVRVGGRCQTESLQKCCIANIRQERKRKRLVPDHIHRRRADMQQYYDMRGILEAAHERIAYACCGLVLPSTLYNMQIMSKDQYRNLLSSNHVNPIFLWLVGQNGGGLPKMRARPKKAAVQKHDGDDDEDEENEEKEEQIDVAEEAALLAEQRELGNDPEFLSNLEESRRKVMGDFAFVPGKRVAGESGKEGKDRHRIELAIEHCINTTDPMSEEEVVGIQDIWMLSHCDRWRLYCYWTRHFIKVQQDQMLRYQLAYERLSEERKEIDREEDYLILRDAKVIGFTTTGAAKHRALLQRVRPRIIVVEEAAEVLEAHIITTLSRDCQHLILIGDHQQLRPKPTVYRLEKQFHLGVSLFERMINNGLPCYRLGQQHRMRPEISVLMKEHFYDGLEDHNSVSNYPQVKGVTKNFYFIEHDHKELKIDDNKSKSNLHEAKFLVEFCYYLLQQGYAPSQITVLTTYTGQLFNFKRLMTKERFEGVRVSVVDNYQGEENDIILLSLVRSNEEGSIGFLKVHNRVCVALSRAKIGLFCIGNIRLLAEKSDLWKKIMKTATSAEQIGPKIPLVCQNHPETLTDVSCPEDFAKVAPDGGCLLPCEARLACGHACRLYCHPKDPKHEEYKCMKDCDTICDRGHKCTLRCYQECKCQVLISKLFAKCQHTGKVKCHEDKTATCQRPCTKTLPCGRHDCPATCGEDCPKMCTKPCPKKITRCGHQCKKKCGMSCMTHMECKYLVDVTRPTCKHTYLVECRADPKWSNLVQHPECKMQCERPLKCGHRCTRKCFERCQTVCKVKKVTKTWSNCKHSRVMACKDTEEAVCEELCARALPCGHGCTQKCKEPCLTRCTKHITKSWPNCQHKFPMKCCDATNAQCSSPCVRRLTCGHRCLKSCSEACDVTQCKLACRRVLPCTHPCKKRCNEPCDITTCTFPCRKLLPCGHQCQKLCNEPCEPDACVEQCKKLLPCEHPCERKCNEQCTTRCKTKVLKEMGCGHRKEVPCCTDIKDYKCFESCLKKLECGHQCKRMCGSAVCTLVCFAKTEKTLPDCGHKITLACHQKAVHSMCGAKCERKLQCGHTCPNLCKEECAEVCTAIVDKELPGCTHKHRLPCATDPTTIKCDRPCTKLLPCQHRCDGICSEQCTSECRMKVRKQHPKCGHDLILRCYEDVVAKTCRKRCRTKLPCGHFCPKMCFEPCKTVDDVPDERAKEKEDAEEGFVSGLHKFTMLTIQTQDMWPICKDRVSKTAKCGHKVECLCCDDPDRIQCQSKCAQLLSCGHRCPGLCWAKCDTMQCKVIVSQVIPTCGHRIRIECYKDPASTICQERCTRKLPCMHPCYKLCSEPCVAPLDLCRRRVVRSLPRCGHEKQLECHQDPSSEQCEKICNKKLQCGHTCSKTCHPSWEVCEPNCRVKVRKTITACGHNIRLPCHLDPDSGSYCSYRCKKPLQCGHECKEKCGRPCTAVCKEKNNVRKMLPCTHVVREVECYKDPKYVFCREQCTGRLSCGHECKNICGECSHRLGRREGKLCRCMEVCRKRLLCGHQCQSRCGDCCGGRLHQPCRARVENVTLLCGCKEEKTPCCGLLRVRHSGYTPNCLLQYRRDYLIDRPEIYDNNTTKCKHNPSGAYCDEPCPELLKCKHPCIGICGEPCIPLCRFCNRRDVLKIFPEFKAESDPCYIRLQSCGHIFEKDQLRQKLSLASETDNCVPILPITCPQCGSAISEKRINKHIVAVASSIQTIDEKLRKNASSHVRAVEVLLSASKYSHTTKNVTARGGRRGGRGQSRVVRQQIKRKAEAHMMWKLKLLDLLNTFLSTCSTNDFKLKSFLAVDQVDLTTRCEMFSRQFVGEVVKLLEDMLDQEIFLTEQLADNLGCELERAHWCAGLGKLIKTKAAVDTYRKRATRAVGSESPTSDWTSVTEAIDIVTSPAPFTIQKRQQVIETLGKELHQTLTTILQKEHTSLRREVVHDMQRQELGFLAGDWFKCSRAEHLFHSRDHVIRRGKATTSAEFAPPCPECEMK